MSILIPSLKKASLTVQLLFTYRFQITSERKAVSLSHLTKTIQVRGKEGIETLFCDSYLAIFYLRYVTKSLIGILVVTYICLLKGKSFVQFHTASQKTTVLYPLRPSPYIFCSDAIHCIQTNLFSSSTILYVFVANKLRRQTHSSLI